MIRLTLPEPPSANTYWRHVPGRARPLLSREARAYRATVQTRCILDGIQALTGDVTLDITWYRSRRAGDVSNRIKQLEDALRGWAYLDDAQVAQVCARRRDGDVRGGTVEVIVEEVLAW